MISLYRTLYAESPYSVAVTTISAALLVAMGVFELVKVASGQ